MGVPCRCLKVMLMFRISFMLMRMLGVFPISWSLILTLIILMRMMPGLFIAMSMTRVALVLMRMARVPTNIRLRLGIM